MAVISNLVVQLKGSTGNLDSALDKSGKKVSDFGNSGNQANKKFTSALSSLPGPLGQASSGLGKLIDMGSGLAGALGPVGGVLLGIAGAALAAAAALVTLGLSSSKTIHDTARMADELGMSYNALVGLQHAAEMTGGSAEDMNTALVHFAAHMGAIGQEAIEVNKHLSKMGLTLQDLQGMTLDKQVAKTTDALKEMDSAQQRVNVQRELFGREGAAIINSLKGGSAAIDDFRRDASALGKTMDENGIQKVEAASEAWKRMKAALEGVGNVIAVTIAPAIETVSKGLTSMIEWVNGAGVMWEKFGLRLLLVWDGIEYGLSRVTTQIIYAFTDTIPNAFSAFGEFAESFFTNLWENIKNGWDALWNDQEFHWKDLGMDKILDRIGKLEAPMTDYEKKLAGEMDLIRQQLKDLEKPRRPNDGFKPRDKKGEDNTVEKGTKAAEKGSQEAFKILAEQGGDKMYALQNNQLKELRDHNKKLDKLLTAWANAQLVMAARIGR